MIREVKEMPTEGQFVMMWEYEKNIWSDTVRWTEGELKFYNPEEDSFINGFVLNDELSIKYFILDDLFS